MPIALKPKAAPKLSRVYPVGQKDMDAVDEAFNKLQDQGEMEWSCRP